MNAVSVYIHYYYKNNNAMSMAYDAFSNQRAKADAKEQLGKFNKAKQEYINSIQLDELSELYEYLVSDASKNDRDEIFDWSRSPMDNKSTKMTFEFGGDILSASAIAARSSKLNDISSSLLEQMIDFKETLESLLSDAVKTLTGKDCYEQYAAAVLNKYCNSKGLSGASAGMINQSIINDFLSKDGLKSLKSISGAPQTALNKLILMAQALPTDGSYVTQYSTKTSSGTIDNLPQFFQIIAAKTQGQWSNVAGRAEEMGALAAEQSLAKKAAKVFGDLDVSIRQGTNIQTSGDISASIRYNSNSPGRIYADTNTDIRKGSGSSQIIITDNNVTVNYGIQVADTNIKPSAAKPYNDVNFSRTVSFANAMTKSSMDLASIYNLAGGHGDGQMYTNAGITRQWNNFKNYVVATSIVDMLTGLPTEHNYIFVLNGRPHDVGEIIEKVIDKVTSSDDNNNNYVNMVTRETMLKQNRWYSSRAGNVRPGEDKDMRDAMVRSNKAIAAITGYLNKATITLNTNALKF